MSFLNWFSRSAGPASKLEAETSGLSRLDVTRPFETPHRRAASKPVVASAPLLKSERMARRELLYAVVRESMVHAGVLSSRYKFKVLSLDNAGVQFLIMIDLAREQAGDMSRLPELETQMAQRAKARHGMNVTAVYWRVSEHVTLAGAKPAPARTVSAHAWAVPDPAQVRPAVVEPVPAEQPQDRINLEELLAFRRALETAKKAGQVPLARHPTQLTGYEDTEASFPGEHAQTLSNTQYGELH